MKSQFFKITIFSLLSVACNQIAGNRERAQSVQKAAVQLTRGLSNTIKLFSQEVCQTLLTEIPEEVPPPDLEAECGKFFASMGVARIMLYFLDPHTINIPILIGSTGCFYLATKIYDLYSTKAHYYRQLRELKNQFISKEETFLCPLCQEEQSKKLLLCEEEEHAICGKCADEYTKSWATQHPTIDKVYCPTCFQSWKFQGLKI